MIKQILILVYILAVLAISSLVRAEVLTPPMIAHATIQQAEVVAETGILNIHGVIPSACGTKPAMLVKGVDKSQNIIGLDVTIVASRRVCNESELVSFDMSYDLKEIPLEVNNTYTIVFTSSNQRLTYKALKPLEGFDLYKSIRKSFVGKLVVTKVSTDYPQSGFALQDGGKEVRVFSPELDLQKYEDGPVSIMGYSVDTASLNGSDNLAVDEGQAETIIVPVSVTRVIPVVMLK